MLRCLCGIAKPGPELLGTRATTSRTAWSARLAINSSARFLLAGKRGFLRRAPAPYEHPDREKRGDQQREQTEPQRQGRALHGRPVQDEVAVALDHVVADFGVGFAGLDLLAHLALQVLLAASFLREPLSSSNACGLRFGEPLLHAVLPLRLVGVMHAGALGRDQALHRRAPALEQDDDGPENAECDDRG